MPPNDHRSGDLQSGLDQNQSENILSSLISPPPADRYPPPLLLLLYAPPILIVFIALTCLTKLLLRRVVRKWLYCRRHHRSPQASSPLAGSGGGVTPCVRLTPNDAQRIFIVRAPAANFPLPAHFLPPNLWAFPPPTAVGSGQALVSGSGLPLPSGALQGYWREDIVEQVINSFPPKYEEAMRSAHQQQQSTTNNIAITRRGRRRQAAQQRRQQQQQQQQVAPIVHPIQVVVPSPPPFYSRRQSAPLCDAARSSPPAYVQTLPGEPLPEAMSSYVVGFEYDGDGSDKKEEINGVECSPSEEPSIRADNDQKEECDSGAVPQSSTPTFDGSAIPNAMTEFKTGEGENAGGSHEEGGVVTNRISPTGGRGKAKRKKIVRRSASLTVFQRRTSFPTEQRCTVGRRSAEDSGDDGAEEF